MEIRVVRRKNSHKYSYNLRSNHQPLDHGIKCVPTAKGAKPTTGRWPRFTGIYGGHTTMLHDPKCRLDYLLAPIRLHHADLFSLDCPSRTPPINTKLKTTLKGFKHQTKSLPRSKLYFPVMHFQYLYLLSSE
ncbi:unnamed protein product [Prunus armeniaca]